MRAVIQRATSGEVRVGGRVVGRLVFDPVDEAGAGCAGPASSGGVVSSPGLVDRIEDEAADDAALDADFAGGGALDNGAHQRDPSAEPRPPRPVEPPRWPASRERSAPGRDSGDTEDLP